MATKKPAQPLTAAQVELVQSMIADRHEQIVQLVDERIAHALRPVQDALGVLGTEAIKWGEKLALRAAAGKLLCAEQGGPSVDQALFTFTSRTNVGPHESFTAERGQG